MNFIKLKKQAFVLISSLFAMSTFGQLLPISFDKVTLQDEFWTGRILTQKNVLIPVAFERTSPGQENLRKAGLVLKGDKSIKTNGVGSAIFDTSDFYKVIEGASCLLKLERDSALEAKIDGFAELIKSAMEDDGYIYPPITGGGLTKYKRYQNILHGHELYNVGHLYEAAVAYYLATGKRNLLDIAEKNAKHVNQVFFVGGDKKYNDGKPVMKAPGHQEIELALVRLYEVTGEKLYLEMAKKFLDIRGKTFKKGGKELNKPEVQLVGSYAQQHLPVREQTKAVGHAVRAGYMYSGMADVGSRAGDKTYTPALKKIWQDIVDTKMHITGGLGAVAGIEGFGASYELPNETAYDETCAAIANVFFNYRMFLLERDAKYIDVAEVALFNNTLSGISFSGDRFFYANPLESYGYVTRPPWYGCACCPTNLSRVIPQVSGMMYAHENNDIYCALYASNSVEIPLKSGVVKLEQKTNYPFDENIVLTIYPFINKQLFTLKMRIPTWTSDKFVSGDLYKYVGKTLEKNQSWSISVNGKVQKIAPENGFVSVKRKWKKGDVVKLRLSMPVRFNKAIERVADNRGRIAITRGPLVYCAEGIDNVAPANVWQVSEFAQNPVVEKQTSGVLKGVDVIKNINAQYLDEKGILKNGTLTLIPYYAWDNRSMTTMNVWFADNLETLKRVPLTRAYGEANATTRMIKNAEATYTHPSDSLLATFNGATPKSSGDKSIRRWSSFTKNGAKQALTYFLKTPTKLSEIAVYWFEETPANRIRLPQSWDIDYMDKSCKWQKFPIYLTDTYSVLKDQFNAVHPSGKPIEAQAVRINIQPQKTFSAGVLQVKFTEAK